MHWKNVLVQKRKCQNHSVLGYIRARWLYRRIVQTNHQRKVPSWWKHTRFEWKWPVFKLTASSRHWEMYVISQQKSQIVRCHIGPVAEVSTSAVVHFAPGSPCLNLLLNHLPPSLVGRWSVRPSPPQALSAFNRFHSNRAGLWTCLKLGPIKSSSLNAIENKWGVTSIR